MYTSCDLFLVCGDVAPCQDLRAVGVKWIEELKKLIYNT